MQLTILIPAFNDWAALEQLLPELDRVVAGRELRVRFVVVDDASTCELPAGFLSNASESLRERVGVLALRRNLSHQRAIAIGLAYLHEHVPSDAVVIMDADGEDAPSDIPKLLAEFDRGGRRNVVFAGRARRSESLTFRMGYWAYRTLHVLLTGERVRVGNFSIVPWTALSRLVVVSDLWNHYAAAVLRSRIPHAIVPTHRGRRIAGRSTMNYTALVVHGLSAIAVYSDVLGVRLMFATAGLSLLLVMGLAAVLCIRLFSSLAIPGWTTYAAGLLVAMLMQAIMSLVMFTFFILWNRNGFSFLPIRDYPFFVASMRPLAQAARRGDAVSKAADDPSWRERKGGPSEEDATGAEVERMC
jgi:polyisoprenyl-phosphate glycosyltransferase